MTYTSLDDAAGKLAKLVWDKAKLQSVNKELSDALNYAIAQLSAYSVGTAIEKFLALVSDKLYGASWKKTISLVGFPKQVDSAGQSFTLDLELTQYPLYKQSGGELLDRTSITVTRK